jgi:nicotinic acid mononucleotide adenylyltransferase
MILNAIGDACGSLESIELGTRDDEPLQIRRAAAEESQRELLHGHRRQAVFGRTPILASGARRAIFPGAFNPLHDGHRAMARLASERLRLPVEFELSIHNVDKPPLDYLEMRDRAAQFGDDETLWLTRAPTFEEKSRLFADATFIVGTDTIARIADPAYSGGDKGAMLAAIDRIARRGGRFLVFGRTADGSFKTLEELDLPPALLAICDQVSEDEFRADVSSTELRRTAMGE